MPCLRVAGDAATPRHGSFPGPGLGIPLLPGVAVGCTQEKQRGKVGSSSVYRNYLKIVNANRPRDLLPAFEFLIGQRLF